MKISDSSRELNLSVYLILGLAKFRTLFSIDIPNIALCDIYSLGEAAEKEVAEVITSHLNLVLILN